MTQEFNEILEKHLNMLEDLIDNRAAVAMIGRRLENMKADLFELCEDLGSYTDDEDEAADMDESLTEALDLIEDIGEGIEEEEMDNTDVLDSLDELADILSELIDQNKL